MKHENLIRIVRLTFAPTKVDEFKHLFTEVSNKVRAVDGCLHLELLQDAAFDNILSTYSIWQNEEKLNVYRKSKLFKSSWSRAKPLFAAPPEAFSSFQIKVLP